MKKFWKDYADLCKAGGKFYTEHWVGCVVLNVAVIAGGCAWFFREPIKETLENKFVKKGKEESE